MFYVCISTDIILNCIMGDGSPLPSAVELTHTDSHTHTHTDTLTQTIAMGMLYVKYKLFY